MMTLEQFAQLSLADKMSTVMAASDLASRGLRVLSADVATAGSWSPQELQLVAAAAQERGD